MSLSANKLVYDYTYKFRLYVAGHTPVSHQALAELRDACRTHLRDRHEIEIVDIARHPQRAVQDGIFMTPALVRLEPAPIKKFIGSFGLTEPLKQALELDKIID
jgi:circadian clock protein KaiB